MNDKSGGTGQPPTATVAGPEDWTTPKPSSRDQGRQRGNTRTSQRAAAQGFQTYQGTNQDEKRMLKYAMQYIIEHENHPARTQFTPRYGNSVIKSLERKNQVEDLRKLSCTIVNSKYLKEPIGRPQQNLYSPAFMELFGGEEALNLNNPANRTDTATPPADIASPESTNLLEDSQGTQTRMTTSSPAGTLNPTIMITPPPKPPVKQFQQDKTMLPNPKPLENEDPNIHDDPRFDANDAYAQVDMYSYNEDHHGTDEIETTTGELEGAEITVYQMGDSVLANLEAELEAKTIRKTAKKRAILEMVQQEIQKAIFQGDVAQHFGNILDAVKERERQLHTTISNMKADHTKLIDAQNHLIHINDQVQTALAHQETLMLKLKTENEKLTFEYNRLKYQRQADVRTMIQHEEEELKRGIDRTPHRFLLRMNVPSNNYAMHVFNRTLLT